MPPLITFHITLSPPYFMANLCQCRLGRMFWSYATEHNSKFTAGICDFMPFLKETTNFGYLQGLCV